MYTKGLVEDIMEKIEPHEDLWLAFNCLLHGNDLPELEAHGMTYNDLRTKYGITALGSLSTLAWIREESDVALTFLNDPRNKYVR